MKEEFDQVQSIYNTIIEFFVTYSFQLLGAVIVLLIGIFIATRIARTVERFCLGKNIDVTLSSFIGSTVKITIIVGTVIICLGKIGISITPFVAAIGALSLGAGLALQGLLANYCAGLNIIITRPFTVGDTITVQNVTGIVDQVHLAYTILSDEDEVKIFIPNRHIIGEIIHNSNENKLALTNIRVAYGSNTDQVETIIRAVLANHPTAENLKPLIGIDEFADSGILFGIRFWIPTKYFHEIRFKINGELYREFSNAGIEIPLPQREVRVLNSTELK